MSDLKFVRAVDRFAMLRRLPENHDGEGACTPNHPSIDVATWLLKALASGDVRPTLGDGGMAVIEIEDRETGLYAEISFTSGVDAEIYVRMPTP